jgi:hypothetical protein
MGAGDARRAEIKVGNCPNLELVATMPPLLQKTLKVVPAPLIGRVPTAPPVLEAPNPTVECKCGNCSAVLMRGDGSLRMKKGPPEEETEWTAPKSHGSTAGENTVAQHVL